MTRDVFQSWLEKGLGRAILFLRDNDDAPYRDLIVHACTHNMAFDRQLESRTAAYEFDLIFATKDPAYYRDRLLASLLAPLEDEDRAQMFDIAELLAKSGDAGARLAMFTAFSQPGNEEIDGAEAIIRMDGFTGFLFIAQCRPETDVDDDAWRVGWWVEILEERHGEAETWIELERMAAENSVVATWIEIVRKDRAENLEKRNAPRVKQRALTYAEMRAMIAEKGRKLRAIARYWHRRAKLEDLALAARDLLTETNPDSLVAYLRIFADCGFPLDPAPIIALAEGEDEEVARAALLVLEHTAHPKVRAFALDCIESSRHLEFAIGMLSANYEPGDSATIARLTKTPLKPDAYHYLQMAARHFVEARWDNFSVPILLNLYENGPCSFCREVCVKLLLEHDALPAELRAEARYDADEDTCVLFAEKK